MAAPVEPAPVEDAPVDAPQSLMLSKSADGSFALVARPRQFLAGAECKPETSPVTGADDESEDLDSYGHAAIVAMEKREDKKKQAAKDAKAAAKLTQADDTLAPTGAPPKGTSIVAMRKTSGKGRGKGRGNSKATKSATCPPGKLADKAALKVKSESKGPPGKLAAHAALKRPASSMKSDTPTKAESVVKAEPVAIPKSAIMKHMYIQEYNVYNC